MSEVMSEDESRGESMTEMVVVPLDIYLGEKFSTFKHFQEKLHKTSKAHFVRFSKRDSRTIEAARRKIKRHINPALEYYQLRYACFFSQKNRPKGTGKRNRISVARQCEVSCPASISLRATEEGEHLEVYNIVEMHNHAVSETDYQRLLPKKRATLESLFEGSSAGGADSLTEDDKYRAVLKKCRFIARLASVSETKSIVDILKDLDDYVYYLKYTTPKEVLDRLKEKKAEESSSVVMEDDDDDDDYDDFDDESVMDESIQIIVEGDGGVTSS